MGAVEHQSNISSFISGKLTNEAGAAMPGVEIFPGITTDEAGHYQITPGTNNISVGDILSLVNPPTRFLYPRKLAVPEQQIQEINLTAYNNPIIDGHTVWEESTNWAGILNIMEDVHLEDIELHLSPGATLRFFNQSTMQVSGTGRIVAGGVPGDTITFTSGNPSNFKLHSAEEEPAWGGIRFHQMSNQANPSVFDHCKIEYVKNYWEEGALHIQEFDHIHINNSLFQYNSGRNGGAIYVYRSQLTIKNTIIRDNGTTPRQSFGPSEGGVGIHAERATLNLLGCLLSDNIGFGYGGGLYARYSEVNIVNSHIVNNHSGFPQVALKSVSNSNSTVNVYNSVIWGNRDGNFIWNITSATPNAVRLYNSCVEGGNAVGTNVYQNCTAENPLFVDAAKGDYRLQPASPLINAGMNDLPSHLVTAFDLLNKPRRMGKRIDIGAYEHEEITTIIHAPTHFAVGQSLQAQAEVYMGTATAYSWDFNKDGLEDANGPSATYSYTDAAPDSIRLIVFISEWGHNDTVYHALQLIEKPLAHFTVSVSTIRRNIAVIFRDASTNGPTQWLWDFGDGNTSTEQHPSHAYAETGEYSVTLSATNAGGTTQHSLAITVFELPEAAFNADVLEGIAPLKVTFSNASTYANTVSWNFGDGTTSTEANPVHIYTTPGEYTVRLTASNDYGENTSTQENLIKVLQPVPMANFTVSSSAVRPNVTVRFTDASTNTPTQWLWDFGDGNTSTEQHPSHAFTDLGRYTVTLSATNAGGTTQYSRPITVYELPRAEFSTDVVEGYAPLTVTFSNASLNDPTSYTWEFGDGTTSTDEHPVHTYTQPGEYSVSLTANNAYGENYRMKSRLIKVLHPLPVAGFTVSTAVVRRHVALTFTDTSTNTPTQWLWDFGDGHTSTEQHPSHAYAETGEYTAMLSATNAGGTTQHSVSITVYELPQATFSADVAEGIAPLSVPFSNTSTNASTYSWDFGDGHTSTEVNPVHIYTEVGEYTVRLTASNDYGLIIYTQESPIKVLPLVDTQLPEVHSSFKVYPNPVGAILMLEADKAYHISVTNLSGQKVGQGTMTGNRHSLNTSAWPTGIYFVRFYNEGESFIHKVVKE